MLRCPHKRIITITKVCIARNNKHLENTIPYKLASLVTFESLKWKYTFASNVLIVTRDESPLVYRAPDASEDSHFETFHIGTSTIRNCTTALFQVTMYTRKVSASANSTLIRYYLLRLKLYVLPRGRPLRVQCRPISKNRGLRFNMRSQWCIITLLCSYIFEVIQMP